MKPTLLAALPFASVLVWVVALIVDPGQYAPGSVALIGVGWLLLATVATVGLVLVGGRWARRTLITVLASTLLVSLFRQVDMTGTVGLATTALALVVLMSPLRSSPVRRLPSASGPPEKAVIVILGALSIPLGLGLPPVEPNQWVLLFATAGPVVAYLYSRTIPGGLAAMRFGLPILAVVGALVVPLPHAVIMVSATALITVFAWSADVAVAFRPLVKRSSSYPIPPELAPKEILDGARIDERGRPV